MTNIVPNKTTYSFIGIVSSDKSDKAITVIVEASKRQPVYHKSFKSTKKFHAHDETNQAKIGNNWWLVEIISTPLSAQKRFRLLKIIESKTTKKA